MALRIASFTSRTASMFAITPPVIGREHRSFSMPRTFAAIMRSSTWLQLGFGWFTAVHT